MEASTEQATVVEAGVLPVSCGRNRYSSSAGARMPLLVAGFGSGCGYLVADGHGGMVRTQSCCG